MLYLNELEISIRVVPSMISLIRVSNRLTDLFGYGKHNCEVSDIAVDGEALLRYGL